MRAARGTAPPYGTQACQARPWAQVYDAEDFPEAALNDYLPFVAWQDHPPRRIAHEARELAQAATWLAWPGHTWREGDLGVWTACVLMLAGPQPDRAARLAVRRAVATLHRAYAYWHWRRTVPWQPFPVHAADRRAWTQSLLPPPD